MNQIPQTIPLWCEMWALWSVRHKDLVRGYPRVSFIADKYCFQERGIQRLTADGERMLTARCKETKTYKPDMEANDAQDVAMAALDSGIAQMGAFRPDLQLIIGAEHLGLVPSLYVESWTPDQAEMKRWDRLVQVWASGRGFKMDALPRWQHATLDEWRTRLGKMLGLSRSRYYVQLEQAYIYLGCWRDIEFLKPQNTSLQSKTV